jgi:hypothetical protein
MFPTILGPNFDFSLLDISWSSARKYPVFLLVQLSRTKAKYGPLTDLLDMCPTILGPNFDFLLLDISRCSVRKYRVFLLVQLSQTKAKYGPLTDLLDMFPTILGPTLDILSLISLGLQHVSILFSVGLSLSDQGKVWSANRPFGHVPDDTWTEL